jgi:hypothetical protein
MAQAAEAEVVPLSVLETAIRTAEEAMRMLTDEQLTELRHRLDALEKAG